MYSVGDSFRVSFKWVVIISTNQEAAHAQSAKISTCYTLWHFGDWSLITGRGGATKRKGRGQVKFYPYKNGGTEKVLAMLKGSGGGHKKVLRYRSIKDRVYWFDGPLSKIGISPQLSIYFMNGIHQIEGNYSLDNMFYPNSNFRKYHVFKHFFTVIF